MSTVVEIEKALQKIPVEDARKIADWLQQYLDEKWDEQIDADIASGKLDKLTGEAVQAYHAGRTKLLDEIIGTGNGNAKVGVRRNRRPKMTRKLAEKRAVGRVGGEKFDGTAFLASLKK